MVSQGLSLAKNPAGKGKWIKLVFFFFLVRILE